MRKLLQDKAISKKMNFILEIQVYGHYMVYRVIETSLKRALIKVSIAMRTQGLPTMYLKSVRLVKQEII